MAFNSCSPDQLRMSAQRLRRAPAGRRGEPGNCAEHLEFCKAKLASYKRVRQLEFAALPKTISGKIPRVELRNREASQRGAGRARRHGVWSDDL